MHVSSRRTKQRALSPEWMLVAITCVWGTTFLMTRIGLRHASALELVALRFAVAAAVMAVLSARSLIGLRRHELRAGVLVGLVIAAGSILQTMALRTTPSSMVAFLTAFYVPLVPLLQLLLLRRAPGAAGWIGSILGFGGLVLIAGPVRGAGGWGEFYGIACAVCFALEIILIGRYASRVDARRFAVVQLAVVALAALACMPFAGEALHVPSWRLLGCVGFLGVASAVVQTVVSWAQKVVAPTRATVIYASEPVWAALAGTLAGERLTLGEGAGAGLIVAGVIVGASRLRGLQALRRWIPRLSGGRRAGAPRPDRADAACRT